MFGVAMVASVFHPSVGGIQTHTLRLSRKLRERGLDVAVLTRPAPGLPAEHLLEGVPVYRLGTLRLGAAAASMTYTAAAVRLLGRLRRRFAIVHAHQMLSPMTVGLLARKLHGIPLVVNPHLSGPGGDVRLLQHHRPLGRARLTAAWRWADAFVCISDAIADELRSAGAPPERLVAIGNGVDCHPPPSAAARLDARRRLGFDPAAPLVVFAGRLVSQKGLDVLLDAWKLLARALPASRLALVGEGDEESKLRAQATALGVADSVRFIGRVSDVTPFLTAANAFVLPSRAEGLPVALLEAMAAGLPVVATAVGGAPQLVVDGHNGALVPPEQADALAARLLEALSPEAKRWGDAGRATVRARYSLDAVADRTLALYRTLLNAKAASTAPAPA